MNYSAIENIQNRYLTGAEMIATANSMANNLQEYRKAAKLSQAKLADLVDTSQPTVQKLESGKTPMSVAWAKKLAPHLKVKFEVLLLGAEVSGRSEPNDAPQDLEVDHGKTPGSGFKSATDEDIARMVRAEKIVDGKYLQSGLILPDEKRTEELAREYRRLTEQDERLRLTQSGAS